MSSLTVLHGCCTIQLTQGRNTLVDADSDGLSQHRWFAMQKGRDIYAGRTIEKWRYGKRKCRTIYMHRQILGDAAGQLIDHRNGDTLDNRRDNLRAATHSQNGANRRKAGNAASRYLGVFPTTRGRPWRARIQKDGKPINIGSFDDEIEAARARDRVAVEIHGEFAKLNFPN